jgi:hypothetical protein
MSLSKSPARPEEAGPALRDAFVEVCERSFFAYAETCDGERFAELTDRVSRTASTWKEGDAHSRRNAVSEWLKASVGFSGPLAGAIEVILPEELARWLVDSITGEPSEAERPELEVFDGLGEFANMVCGAWLTILFQRHTFELRPPVVTRMTPQWTPVTDSGWNDERGYRLVINELPVRLRLR